jgi:hypothetical protein
VPLSGDLLAQARHLALKESKKPLQASLRRAVSAAYYSLFHFLVENATRFLIAGNQTERRRMREQLGPEVAMAGWGAIRDSAPTQAYLVSLLAQSRR